MMNGVKNFVVDNGSKLLNATAKGVGTVGGGAANLGKGVIDAGTGLVGSALGFIGEKLTHSPLATTGSAPRQQLHQLTEKGELLNQALKDEGKETTQDMMKDYKKLSMQQMRTQTEVSLINLMKEMNKLTASAAKDIGKAANEQHR